MSITACIHCNTDSWFDVTSVNFNSQKVHEDKWVMGCSRPTHTPMAAKLELTAPLMIICC